MTKNNTFLKKIPSYKEGIVWSQDQNGLVTIKMQNRGVANRIAQVLLKKPRVSFIHLDEFGSFVWASINGKRNIIAIGELVRNRFGDKAEPLYERLLQYIKTLQTNRFITII